MIPLEITGIREVIMKLTGFRMKFAHATERGLVKSGLLVMRESQKMVPVQMGPLKASAFTDKSGSGFATDVMIGYNGPLYAAYVHEIPGIDLSSPVTHGQAFNIKHAAEIAAAKGTPFGTAAGGMFNRKPEEQWKYLERPLWDNLGKIFGTITNEILKVK